MSDLDLFAAAIQSQVTRGKVTDTRVGPRTLLQVTGLADETMQTIELLLPYGYSARPAAGADVLLVQVLGRGDHQVALGGDAAGGAIGDLAPGEVGLIANGHQIVLRTDRVEITTPAKVVCTTPQFTILTLPSSPAGLPSGTLWQQGGAVRVVP